jgi:adenosylhomocysteinase
LEKRVYEVPNQIDRQIAQMKLESMGIQIDQLTAEQEHYLASWEQGT